jgi:hypothetical protein
MANNILKEAIADAKAVREVALANAKAALEEAFTPKLQNMLSAKLSEDLDGEYYEDGDEDIDLGEMDKMYDEDKEDLELGEEVMDDKEDSMDEEIDLEEILNELEEAEGDDSEEEEIEEVHRVGQPNYRGDGVSDVLNRASDINDNLAENQEFDLDSLLKEINDLDENDDDEEEIDEQMMMQQPSIKRAPMRKNPAKRNPSMMGRKGGSCMEEKKTIMSLQKQIKESKKAYITVKSELNEVNLLNSKLLYVNRIFKANNLDDAQKLRVVETLDKAGSIKESKLIYETIKDTFTISNKKSKSVSKKPIKENLTRKRKGMASKAIKTSAPRKPILKESNNMVARMQKLANISKIN